MKRLPVVFLLLTAAADAARSEEPAVPFPEALRAAAVAVDRLDSLLDNALLVGNGDINGLVYVEGGTVKVMLTKNDVWDARLDTARDPPLPKISWIKRAVAEGRLPANPQFLEDGCRPLVPDSYHSHPYPCPRACGRLILGRGPGKPTWQRIRAEGRENDWQSRDGAAVMSIAGRAGASNGFAVGPLDIAADRVTRLRVKLSGTANARFFIDLMGTNGRAILSTGWADSPAQVEERVYKVPAGRAIDRVFLYTWTKDGRRAQNRFESVSLEGPAGSLPIDLRITAPPACPGRLDLERAAVQTAELPDGPPPAEVRALADRNVLLVRSPVSAALEAARSTDTPDASSGQTDGIAWLEQAIPGDLDWPGMGFAVAVASQDPWKAVAIVTSREAKDPRAAAIELARRTLQTSPDALVRHHETEWSRFWSASGIAIDDPLLQAAWYRNLYFLRCVSKPGSVAPGLFASLINDRPAWHGDYHTNYNIQQTFWTAYVTNHGELAEPYNRLIRDYLPRACWLARQVFSMEGAYYPHVLFAYEPAEPEKCRSPIGRQYLHQVWGFTIGVTGFTVQPLWWCYKYAPSRDFLEATAYPPVREAARFYADFIDHCAGEKQVVLAPSVSPEHWGWTKDFQRNRNCAMDIAMIRHTLEAAIEGAATLARDADQVTRWKRALGRLPPYPTTASEPPIVVDVQDAPPITYNIAVPATPVFPCDVVTWWSPRAEKDLFIRTIDQLKWNGNNSAIILAVARARLSMPQTLAWVREELAARLRPNGTLTLNRLKPHQRFNDFGHYTEQFAASMAVSELLVQSVGDVIRVFPAWPPDRDAEFRDLRAQGGLLVSAGIRQGKTPHVTIRSTVGGTVRLLSPWPRKAVSCNGKPVAANSQEVIELPAVPGDVLVFRAL